MIKAHFEPIPAPATPRPRPDFHGPGSPGHALHAGHRSGSDRHDGQRLQQDAGRDQRPSAPIGSRWSNGCSLACSSARLDEVAQRPDAPFLGGRDQPRACSSAPRIVDVAQRWSPDGGRRKRRSTALFTETERVARFGFTATELDREKLDMRRYLERALVEEGQAVRVRSPTSTCATSSRTNRSRASSTSTALPQRFLPEITLAEVNALARTGCPTATASSSSARPRSRAWRCRREAKLAAAIKAGSGDARWPPTSIAVNAQPLLEPMPTPGTVVKTHDARAIGITEWELSNGVRVVLKPTTYKQDEILFRAVSPGGTSLASDQDFVAAETADAVVDRRRARQADESDLTRCWPARRRSSGPSIGDDRGGAARRRVARGRRDDVPAGLPDVHAAARRPGGVRGLRRQLQAALANRRRMPDAAFDDARRGRASRRTICARGR